MPGQAAAYYRQKCLDCHGPALLETHAAPTENCIGCHMPQREPTDVAHTAYTDHQIQRRPAAATDTQLPERLVAWREPATTLSERNRGLAYVRAGENHQSIPQLQQGYRLLTEARKNFPEDPAVLSALGRVLFLNKTFERAAEMFETAARVEPGNANHRLALGDAYGAMEESEKAIESYERAIELDPSLKDAYVNLAALYGRLGQPEKRRETIQRHLEFMPRSPLTVRAGFCLPASEAAPCATPLFDETYQSTTEPSSGSYCGWYSRGSPTCAINLSSSMVMPMPGSGSSGRYPPRTGGMGFASRSSYSLSPRS
jgi:tetratricopeptide (TPR) repeat protein